MTYIIKHKELNTYYAKDVDKVQIHFVEDIQEAYIFKNKWEANRKLKELGNNFEIVRK